MVKQQSIDDVKCIRCQRTTQVYKQIVEDNEKKKFKRYFFCKHKTNSAGIKDMVRLHLSGRYDCFSNESLLAILIHSR